MLSRYLLLQLEKAREHLVKDDVEDLQGALLGAAAGFVGFVFSKKSKVTDTDVEAKEAKIEPLDEGTDHEVDPGQKSWLADQEDAGISNQSDKLLTADDSKHPRNYDTFTWILQVVDLSSWTEQWVVKKGLSYAGRSSGSCICFLDVGPARTNYRHDRRFYCILWLVYFSETCMNDPHMTTAV